MNRHLATAETVPDEAWTNAQARTAAKLLTGGKRFSKRVFIKT